MSCLSLDYTLSGADHWFAVQQDVVQSGPVTLNASSSQLFPYGTNTVQVCAPGPSLVAGTYLWNYDLAWPVDSSVVVSGLPRSTSREKVLLG